MLFSRKVSRFCFRCWSLFICHFRITTGLFVEWVSRIKKRGSYSLFLLWVCLVPRRHWFDFSLEIPVLGIRLRRHRVASAAYCWLNLERVACTFCLLVSWPVDAELLLLCSKQFGKEAVWDSESVWTLWWRRKYLSLSGIESRFSCRWAHTLVCMIHFQQH
jgi:hypothetical protein